MIARQTFEKMGSRTTINPMAAKLACNKQNRLASQLAATSGYFLLQELLGQRPMPVS